MVSFQDMVERLRFRVLVFMKQHAKVGVQCRVHPARTERSHSHEAYLSKETAGFPEAIRRRIVGFVPNACSSLCLLRFIPLHRLLRCPGCMLVARCTCTWKSRWQTNLPLVSREWKNGSNSSYNCTPFLHSLLTKGKLNAETHLQLGFRCSPTGPIQQLPQGPSIDCYMGTWSLRVPQTLLGTTLL